MKNKLQELDVDFIGEQTPMTKEEELMISEFIKEEKSKRKLKEKLTSKSRLIKKENETV